jgi:[ribosomal protein S5]-alanine N-acetyltransferase
MIETNRLQLIPCQLAHLEAFFNKEIKKMGQLLDADATGKWTEFPEGLQYTYAVLNNNKNNTIAVWWSYFIIHKIDKKLIGTCGFKGSPDAEGMVEIGYEITPLYRLKGLATETAQGLIDFATQHETVQLIRAHTLATANPSVTVLEKLGFHFVGTFNDPDDGDVWRWEKDK